VDGFEAWREVALRYNEQKINDHTTIYDFFLLLEKAMQRQEQEKQAYEKAKRRARSGK
jgi:hypothetical protein